MKIGKAKAKGIAGVTPPRKKGDPERVEGYVTGRPTMYRREYCQSLVDYFSFADSWEMYNANKTSTAQIIPKSKLPTFQRWCAGIGIGAQTMSDWRNKHPEFEEAYLIAKDLQCAFLLELGAAGVGNHVLALMLRTNHGMKDAPEPDDKDNSPIQKVVVEVVGANHNKGD
jgi:hypothetical protein